LCQPGDTFQVSFQKQGTSLKDIQEENNLYLYYLRKRDACEQAEVTLKVNLQKCINSASGTLISQIETALSAGDSRLLNK
jgi:hypothetical protein